MLLNTLNSLDKSQRTFQKGDSKDKKNFKFEPEADLNIYGDNIPSDGTFRTQTLSHDAASQKLKRTKAWKKERSAFCDKILDIFTKCLFFKGAIGLICISVIRFNVLKQGSVHDLILNWFYLCLSVITVLSQLKIAWILRNFRFLNYHWGKALFSFFLGSVSFSNETFIQLIMSTYFFTVSCCFITLSMADKSHDANQNRKDEIDSAAFAQLEANEKGILDAPKSLETKADKMNGAVKNNYKNIKADPRSDDSTADYGSDLMSDLDSDHDNSKYGINGLRRPFF